MFESFAMVSKRSFTAYAWILWCCRSDDEDDDEGGEGVCEQQKQPTLQESQYVKQIGKFCQQIPWDTYWEQDEM